MAMISTWYEQDLTKPVKVHQLPGNVFSQDNQGNLVGVHVYNDGEPAVLTGTVSGYVVRADSATVPCEGVLSGNDCSIILPSTAYAIEGQISIVIKLEGDGSTTTLCAVVAYVYKSTTDTPVDPGTVIPSIEDLLAAIDSAVAQIPPDYSALKRNISSIEEDSNGEISSHIVWELGGINTDTGAETTRSDCVRTPMIPIGNTDSIQCIRLDTDNKASGWWANAHYYDESMTYIASVKPGTSQYNFSFMRIPALSYPRAAYVRFSILTTTANIMANFASIWDCFVRRGSIKAYNEKLIRLKSNYNIYDLDFTNAGGISQGTPYDIAQDSARFRTTTGYPFPIGSFLVIPDEFSSIYELWCTAYWDAGRYCKSFFGDDAKRLDTITQSSFSGETENYYMAISGKTLDNLTIINDMITELDQFVKIAVPKNKSYGEDRLSGVVSGGENLFDKIPFQYGRASYFYETDKNALYQRSEDYRVWDPANADFVIDLPAGTYTLCAHFLGNTGDNPSAIALKVYNSGGTAIIDIGGRTATLYDNPKEFTLQTSDTIKIQWKSYIGNKFSLYLISDSFDTLKTVSRKVEHLVSYTGDDKFIEIYSDPVQTLIGKYDATVNAGNIGYIWMSDLHINSLYPERNKALKRQLMACAEIANRTNIQFIMIGGDIIDREVAYSTIYSLFNEVFVGTKESRRPILLMIGNHDDNPYTNDIPLTKDQAKALFIDMNGVEVISPAVDKSYYYFDRLGYRFICMDSIDYPSGYSGSNWWSFSQAQIEWLATLLLSTNQKIIMMSHITPDPYHECYNLGDEGGYVSDACNLVDAYNKRESITLYGHTYNFASNTGKILFWHAGHQHFDEQYIPVSTRTAQSPTTSATGWRLNEADGLCSQVSGYKLEKYLVTAGERIKVVSDDRFQFQNDASVPASGQPNRVGDTYQSGTFELIVPNNATYLIVSTPTSGSTASVEKLGSRSFPVLITTSAKDQTTTDSLILLSGNTYMANPNFSWNSLGWTCKFWPNRILETITEAAFDVVSVGSNLVNVFRVGAGEDRSFSI